MTDKKPQTLEQEFSQMRIALILIELTAKVAATLTEYKERYGDYPQYATMEPDREMPLITNAIGEQNDINDCFISWIQQTIREYKITTTLMFTDDPNIEKTKDSTVYYFGQAWGRKNNG